MKKVCSRCKRELPEEKFSKSRNAKDGLQGYCKECDAAYRRDRAEFEKKRLRLKINH